MTTAADANIAALRSGFDQLAAFVRGLRPDELTGPSGSSEWDVSQVLSHLGSGGVIGLAGLEAALAGQPNPGNDFNRGVWAEWDAMSPSERAQGFPEANEKLVSRFEALDPGTRESLKIDMGFLPEPVSVATAAAFRLSEFTLHAWDVRVGFDQGAVLDPQATPLLMDQSPLRLDWLAKPEALQGKQATLAVHTTDPQRVFTFDLGEKVTLVAQEPVQPDGVLTLPAESLLRLIAGRLSGKHTPDSVSLHGSAITLDDLRRMLPGF